MAGLFNLHQAIALDGIGVVRQRCATKQQRASVNAAVATLAARAADANGSDDALYASVLVTGLPHKKLDHPGVPLRWEHECAQACLRYESRNATGLPYGAKARMVLLYLQTEAIRNNSPEVELGPSMHAWLRSMTRQTPGGMTYRIIREQATRLFDCQLSIMWKSFSAQPLHAPLVRGLSNASGEPHGTAQCHAEESIPARAVLHEAVFQAIRASAVRVRRSAIQCISHNGTAMDQYILMSQRLPTLPASVAIPWPALAARFGTNYKRFSQMRPRYLDALRLALAVYPEARIDVTAHGLVLHPSPPPA